MTRDPRDPSVDWTDSTGLEPSPLLPDVRPEKIDFRLALTQPLLLAEVNDAILLEARGAARLSTCLRAMWYDVDACLALTMEDYDSARLTRALRDYLDAAGLEPALEAADVSDEAGLRSSSAVSDDPIAGLVELMLADRLSNTLFQRLSQRAAEPVLAELLELAATLKRRRIRRVAHLVIRRMSDRRSRMTDSLGITLGELYPPGEAGEDFVSGEDDHHAEGSGEGGDESPRIGGVPIFDPRPPAAP